MELQLKKLRTSAGYRSRKSFAAAVGYPERQVKAWEEGERNLRLEQACALADFFGCTLDELAGHEGFDGRFADPRQNAMNDDYSELSEPGKDSAAGAVHGIRIAEDVQKEAEAPPDTGRAEVA